MYGASLPPPRRHCDNQHLLSASSLFSSAPAASFDPNPAHSLTFLLFQITSYRRLQLTGSQNALLQPPVALSFFRSFPLVWMSVREAAKLQDKQPHRLRNQKKSVLASSYPSIRGHQPPNRDSEHMLLLCSSSSSYI